VELLQQLMLLHQVHHHQVANTEHANTKQVQVVKVLGKRGCVRLLKELQTNANQFGLSVESQAGSKQ